MRVRRLLSDLLRQMCRAEAGRGGGSPCVRSVCDAGGGRCGGGHRTCGGACFWGRGGRSKGPLVCVTCCSESRSLGEWRWRYGRSAAIACCCGDTWLMGTSAAFAREFVSRVCYQSFSCVGLGFVSCVERFRIRDPTSSATAWTVSGLVHVARGIRPGSGRSRRRSRPRCPVGR